MSCLHLEMSEFSCAKLRPIDLKKIRKNHSLALIFRNFRLILHIYTVNIPLFMYHCHYIARNNSMKVTSESMGKASYLRTAA